MCYIIILYPKTSCLFSIKRFSINTPNNTFVNFRKTNLWHIIFLSGIMYPFFMKVYYRWRRAKLIKCMTTPFQYQLVTIESTGDFVAFIHPKRTSKIEIFLMQLNMEIIRNWIPQFFLSLS